jgi:hypothetical protein
LQKQTFINDCKESREVYVQRLLDALPSDEAHTLSREDSSSSSSAQAELTNLERRDEMQALSREDISAQQQQLGREMNKLEDWIASLQENIFKRRSVSSSSSSNNNDSDLLKQYQESHAVYKKAFKKLCDEEKRRKAAADKEDEYDAVPSYAKQKQYAKLEAKMLKQIAAKRARDKKIYAKQEAEMQIVDASITPEAVMGEASAPAVDNEDLLEFLHSAPPSLSVVINR